MPDRLFCVLCLEEFLPTDVTFLRCAHSFCRACLRRMPVDKCPLCRTPRSQAASSSSTVSALVTSGTGTVQRSRSSRYRTLVRRLASSLGSNKWTSLILRRYLLVFLSLQLEADGEDGEVAGVKDGVPLRRNPEANQIIRQIQVPSKFRKQGNKSVPKSVFPTLSWGEKTKKK